MTARHLLRRLRALLHQGRLDRELDAEIAAHLEMAEHDARARGLSPEDARLEARRAFGAVLPMREVHRDARSVRWVEHLMADARHGLAGLRRAPLFAMTAVGLLALGIGANTAVFSLVDGVLFRPLPFPEPDRIVRIWETPTLSTTNSTTTRTFVELQRQNQTFEALSAESASTATVVVNGEPVRLTGRYVSADHFAVFGVQPLLGRGFRREEDHQGAAKVVVLSHAAWLTHFGGDAAVIGRVLRLDNEPHEVIGVLPPGPFDRDRERGPVLSDPASFWRLNAFDDAEMAASSHWLNPVGRLKPGVTVEQARQDVADIRARLADTIPAWKQHWGLTVEPFDARLVADRMRQSMYVALGAVVLVLALACANLTNLLLARGVSRRQELAVRAALGAGRGRIAAQLLVETLVLGGLGGVAGVALAALLVRAGVPLLPPMPFTVDVGIDWRVLTFAAVTSLTVSVTVGMLPAMRIARAPAAIALLGAARGVSATGDRTRRALVAVEVAVSVVLLCGAFLLGKSLWRLQQVDVGARLDHVVTMALDLSWDRYPTGNDMAAFYPRLTDSVRAIPGVVAASVSGDVPLEGTGGENLRQPGRDERLLVRFKRADDAYFATLGIPVMAGRPFAPSDRVGAAPVAVVNQALARQLADRFGMSDPVGQAVDLPALGFGRDRRAVMTIVGVVGNERVRPDLREPADPVAYVPIAQAPRLWIKLAVRTTADPAAVVPEIREVVRRLDDRLALADIRTMEQIRDRSLAGTREPAWLVGAFALISVGLAALGLYGVLAHAVATRQREIGIRLALGAAARDVVAMVTRSTLAMVGAGLGVGLLGALAVGRLGRSLLFEVSVLEPWALVFGAAVMTAIAAAAAVVPTRRATRIDPALTLRADG